MHSKSYNTSMLHWLRPTIQKLQTVFLTAQAAMPGKDLLYMEGCTCAQAGHHPKRELALEVYIAAHTAAHLCLVGLENHSIIVRILADASAVREQTLCPGGPWALHLLHTAHTVNQPALAPQGEHRHSACAALLPS